ncbi:hypothetical protein GMRT_15615 [Giardia muris]|uniref:Uncharacterized protein n=1 Tax=Giardia muris TaxID=5742 RepID=A0A4Z1SSD4_GIAMU|nr:hypothetical protein GMRT_15615 [Giardia muris]|eukprot:TNJ28794.1 hypothetical protein GMRT_15615 [Giardia muris]
MELPDFQVELTQQHDGVDQEGGFAYNADIQAPASSLLAASLESLSFQLARQKQSSHDQAPDFDSLASRLAELASCAASDTVDLGMYKDVIQGDATPEVKLNAFHLASMKSYSNALRIHRTTMATIRERLLKGMKPGFWERFFSSLTLPVKLTDTDKRHLEKIKDVTVEPVEANYEALNAHLLKPETATTPVSQKLLPGFRITFLCLDDSILSSTFRQLLDGTVSSLIERNVAGADALAMVNSLGTTYHGLFGLFVPPTEADLNPTSGNVAAHQIALTRAKKIIELAHVVKAGLLSLV